MDTDTLVNGSSGEAAARSKRDWKFIVLLSIVNAMAQAGQGVTIPLFIDSFKSSDASQKMNPYFVLLYGSFMFVVIFGVMVVYRRLRYGSPIGHCDMGG